MEINQDFLKQEIITIMADTLGVTETQILHASELKELNMDSLDMYEIIMKIEEVSGKQIEPEQLMQLETVNDILEFIER